MKATDLKFKFEAQVNEDMEWYGHVQYKNLPYTALELMGKQIQKDGKHMVPINYADSEAEYGTSTLFWMNINDSGNLASGNVQIFNMSFPVKGFIHMSDKGMMSVTLSADIKDTTNKKTGETYTSSYNFVMEKIKKNEVNKNGKLFEPYVLESAGELQEADLISYSKTIEGFDEWKERNMKRQLKQSAVRSPLLCLIPEDETAF